MKAPLACATFLSFLGLSVPAQTNQWTKPISGSWEDPYWSLSQLPGINQTLVVIDNYGWKAVAIGPTTTANYPQSLFLNNLLVDGPTNSKNTLLLNWAQLSVPLNVNSNLTIGTNGSLVSHYSALHAANACIGGSASFSDYSIEDFGQLKIQSGATLGLTNGVMTCSNLTFDRATFTQSGGLHVVQNITLPEIYTNDQTYSSLPAAYNLQDGALTSQHLSLGAFFTTWDNPVGHPEFHGFSGSFWQTGGIHTNSEMMLAGYYGRLGPAHVGGYQLDGGLLVSGFVDVEGSFNQTGGTNIIRDLQAGDPGSYYLSGGELITSNTTVLGYSEPQPGFLQTGGIHVVASELILRDGYPLYRLTGGNLVTANIDNIGGNLILSSQGVVSNSGVFRLAAPSPSFQLVDTTEPQYMGQLQLESLSYLDMHCYYPYVQPTNAIVIRFLDSHTLPWTGLLDISGWGLNSGDHIYFGTNAQALTATQLAQVRFYETNGVNYSARLLATGELVPVVPPTLNVTRQGKALVLSWTNDYELVSATNVIGPYLPVPGAVSPLTNTFIEPQRFFRLRMPAP